MVEAREGKDLAKLASRHLEEKYGCSSQDIILSQQQYCSKKVCQAAMWSHLSEGKSAFEDDLKEKNAKSPNVNLRSHLVIGKDRAGTSRNQRVLHFGDRPLKITKYSL